MQLKASSSLFCFGLGYTASFVAKLWQSIGGNVTATTRHIAKYKWIEQQGYNAKLFNLEHPLKDPRESMSDITHMLISIPPHLFQDVVLTEYKDFICTLPKLQWVGYLSTTGVYGDYQGKWVDETAETRPYNDRLRGRVAAENAWLSLYKSHKLPIHIFRLSGIYGPDRNALTDVLSGKAKRLDKKGQVFSRMHVEDIAYTLMKSMQKPTPGAIYNLADDYPTSQRKVVEYACQLLHVVPPPLISFEQADLSEMAKSFYQACKRVSNDKIKRELGVELRFPSYKEGLDQLFSKIPL